MVKIENWLGQSRSNTFFQGPGMLNEFHSKIKTDVQLFIVWLKELLPNMSIFFGLGTDKVAHYVRKMQFVILRIRIGNCREYSNIQWYWLVASGSSYMGTTIAIDHSNLGILGCKYATMQLGQIAPFASICPISPLPNGGPQNSSQTLSRTTIATWLVLSLDWTPLTPAWKRAPAVLFLEAATTWLPATSSSTVIQLKCSQVNVDLPHAWTFTFKFSVLCEEKLWYVWNNRQTLSNVV